MSASSGPGGASASAGSASASPLASEAPPSSPPRPGSRPRHGDGVVRRRLRAPAHRSPTRRGCARRARRPRAPPPGGPWVVLAVAGARPRLSADPVPASGCSPGTSAPLLVVRGLRRHRAGGTGRPRPAPRRVPPRRCDRGGRGSRPPCRARRARRRSSRRGRRGAARSGSRAPRRREARSASTRRRASWTCSRRARPSSLARAMIASPSATASARMRSLSTRASCAAFATSSSTSTTRSAEEASVLRLQLVDLALRLAQQRGRPLLGLRPRCGPPPRARGAGSAHCAGRATRSAWPRRPRGGPPAPRPRPARPAAPAPAPRAPRCSAPPTGGRPVPRRCRSPAGRRRRSAGRCPRSRCGTMRWGRGLQAWPEPTAPPGPAQAWSARCPPGV